MPVCGVQTRLISLISVSTLSRGVPMATREILEEPRVGLATNPFVKSATNMEAFASLCFYASNESRSDDFLLSNVRPIKPFIRQKKII